MAAYTSNAAGNWTTATVWTPNGVPGAGDSVTINHAITVLADTTIGAGAAATVLTVGTGGTLTVTGCKLTIRGNSSWGDGGYSFAQGGGWWLTVQPAGSIPGGIELDGNAGVSPIVTSNNNANFRFLGTATAHCFVRTKAGTAGNPGRFAAVGGGVGTLLTTATYCDFSRLGDASNMGYGLCSLEIGAATGIVSLDHCTFDSCGVAPYILATQNDNKISLTNTTWTNSLGPCSFKIATQVPIGTGIRAITGCVVMGPYTPQFLSQQDFTITGNYFDQWSSYSSAIESASWAAFTGNFVRKQTTDEALFAGDVKDSYFFVDVPGGGSCALVTDFNDFTYSGNLFDTSLAGTFGYAIGFTEASNNPRSNSSITRNVLTPSPNAWPLVSANTNSSQANPLVVAVTHNTAGIGGWNGAMEIIGTGGGERAGSISLLRDNLFWATGSPSGPMIWNSGGGSSGFVTNVVTAPNCNHNAYGSLAVQPANKWTVTTPVTGATTCSDGTVYHTPMSGTLSPGVSDVGFGVISSAVTQGPRFIDPTRNLAAWSVFKGFASSGATTAAKVTAALTAIRGNLTLIADAVTWVRGGFVTQQASIATAASDGTAIGAMTYTPATGGATSYTLGGPTSGTVSVASSVFTATPVGGNATTTITPQSSGAGTFSPASLSFSGTSAAQTFTYTPTSTTGSPHTITTTASPTLGTNPAGILYTVNAAVATGYTLTAPSPAKGDVTVASGNFTITPAAPFTGTITVTLSGGMTGTVVKTFSASATPQTFTITPTRAGVLVNLTATNSGSLTNPAPVTYLGMVQLGKSGTAPSGNISPSFGGQDFCSVGPWAQEFKRDITGDPVDPSSAAMLALYPSSFLHMDFSATGSGGGFGGYGIPYNVVPSTQPLKAITYTGYPSGVPPDTDHPSDPGPIPIPAVPSIENWTAPTLPNVSPVDSDQHMLIAVRDETTGLVATLWEINKAWTSDAGVTWQAAGAFKFDVATGAQRTDDVTSAEAGGMRILTALLLYEEVAAAIARDPVNGDVGHTIRFTMPACYGLYTWPAKVSTGGDRLRPAMGGRLRLTAAWYNANKATYTGQARIILNTIRKYGLIMCDSGGTFYVGGCSDDRWDPDGSTHGIFAIQNVPASALEVVQYTPGWVHTGPTSGVVGTAYTFTASLGWTTSNARANIYLTLNGATPGATHSTTAIGLVPGSSPSGTYTFTPAAAGTYTLDGGTGGKEWMTPPPITFTANATSSPATSYSLIPPTPATGNVGAASGNFTLQASGPPTTALVVTPSAGAGGGTFTPATVTINDALAHTFTYTPASLGIKTIAVTHTGGSGITGDPASVSYTAGPVATSYTMTPPSSGSGTVGSMSGAFLLQANTTPSTALVVTPSDGGGGGAFTPTTVTIPDATVRTFNYTPATAGTKTISVTHTGGVEIAADPAPVTYAVTAPTTTTTWQTGVIDAFPPGLVAGSIGGTVGFGFKIGLDGGNYGSLITANIVEDSPGSYSAQVPVSSGAIPRFRWFDGSGRDVTDLNPLALPGTGTGGGGGSGGPVTIADNGIRLASYAPDTRADGTMRAASSSTVIHFDAADARANVLSGTLAMPVMVSVANGQLVPIASVSGAAGAKDGTVLPPYTITPTLTSGSPYYWTDVPAGVQVTSWMGAAPAPMISGSVQSLPPSGTVVAGSGSNLTVTGYPVGKIWTGQHLYHVPSGEARIVASATYSAPNYNLVITGTFSAVAPGDAVCLLS